MPKKLSEDLNVRIEAEVARHGEGIGIDNLHAALADIVSRRTLQRRLGELVEQKNLVIDGKGRGLRYRRAPRIIEVDITEQVRATDQPSAEVYVPVSPTSQEVLDYVRQPIQQRRPVGYDRSFLEAYRPNETRPRVGGCAIALSKSAARCFTRWASRSRPTPISA